MKKKKNGNKKPKNNTGTAVIEYNHSGIPDDQLKPEDFDERQLAVLAALPPARQAQIRKGCPVSVIDLGTGATIADFNLRNVKPSDFEMEMLARGLYESIRKYYSDPENVRKYEERRKDNEV